MTQERWMVCERISRSLEEAMGTLLDKLCEGEPSEVSKVAWDMFVTRVAFANGRGDCFVLPPIDEC
ncbi:MAG: hypothetical protein J6V52_01685 [Bacteroidaceae bacterium]|nr:hypothetical protein [Bacteroidaceae bacterium]